MKNIFVKISILALVMGLSSCLKDDDYALDPEGVKNVVEFLDPSVPASPAGAIYPAYSTSYTLSPSAVYEIQVSYSGPEDAAPQNINIELGVDPIRQREHFVELLARVRVESVIEASGCSVLSERLLRRKLVCDPASLVDGVGLWREESGNRFEKIFIRHGIYSSYKNG